MTQELKMMADLHFGRLSLLERNLGTFLKKIKSLRTEFYIKDGCSLSDLAHCLYKVFCSCHLGVLKPHTIYPRHFREELWQLFGLKQHFHISTFSPSKQYFHFFSTWTHMFLFLNGPISHISVVWM